ncbi:MAG TPA: SDR family NAD(P)-dependent oxidoreductase [Polyangia bacterium]|nr:SDR family NAD(P)-dependent oxidoreductase [Polyangia bacterium]
MALVAALKGKGPNGFGFSTTAEEATAGADLHGKTVLVTGCNSGLGLETIRVLALRGARVVATARTVDKAREACAGLRGDFLPLACELGDPASVRACVAAVKDGAAPLDAILCNAGVMAIPTPQQKFGWELHLFTNHIGHFILVTGLLDRLAPAGRVVVTASRAHHRAPAAGIEFDNLSGERGYAPMKAYGVSKLANILFTRELARRLGQGGATGQTANALHPGVISTNITRTIPSVGQLVMRMAAPILLKTIPQGAATQCYLAASPAVANVSGEYYSDCNPEQTTAAGRDMAMAARLWQESEALVARLP